MKIWKNSQVKLNVADTDFYKTHQSDCRNPVNSSLYTVTNMNDNRQDRPTLK